MSAQPQTSVYRLQLDGLILSSRYQVMKRVRGGSFSELWQARNIAPQTDEPRVVVVKALNTCAQGKPTPDFEQLLTSNFENEAVALRECRQKHMVRIFDHGAAFDNTGYSFRFLVLEFLAGGSIKDSLHNGALELSRTLVFLRQVAGALSVMHEKRLIHRDIKPANIMLSGDGQTAKLIDLGTVLRIGEPIDCAIGTRPYSAPEQFQFKEGATLTIAADVYAIAMTTYAMLIGVEPRQTQTGSFPGNVLNQSWASPVLRVLNKATSDDPAARHQSVNEFLNALEDSLEETTYAIKTARPRPGKSRVVVDLRTGSATRHRLWMRLFLASMSYFVIAAGFSWSSCRRLLAVLTEALFSIGRGLKRVPGKLYVFILVVVIFCWGVLLVGPAAIELSRRLLRRPLVVRQTAPDLNRFKAATDINIRRLPGARSGKIGLVERDSIVRLIRRNENGTWCEIEILNHGRLKTNPGFVDRGWISCQYMTPLS